MRTVRPKLLKRIHVNRHNVASNAKAGAELKPALTIQTSRGAIPCRAVHIRGASWLVQGLKPLKCGARIWIETRAEIAYE